MARVFIWGIRMDSPFDKRDTRDSCEVNPESWTQLKGSNEKGI